PRIAIIGAGPSGLVLLNVLARHDIPATLYERDERSGSRAHLGGMFDLHIDAGQAAMKGAGLWEPFLKHARPEGQEMIISDRTGETLFHLVPPPGAEQHAAPEIDRTMLREILVDAAPPGGIKWGHALVSANPVPGTAEWELTFSNGFKTVVDLLVGADGARSRVRPLVTVYTGITCLEVSFDSAAHPELAARVGKGSMFAIDEYKAIASQRNGDGRIRTYLYFHADEDAEHTSPVVADPRAAVADAVARYAGWAPWQLEIIQAADLNAVYLRPFYMMPVDFSWTHRAGATLVGDAMSLMPPFAGKGANIAMLAALKLGLAL
ncbi:FAD/NAD(P)-binding domain-containing protein, partial [Auricularia subglabra TFB-10046 SS5]